MSQLQPNIAALRSQIDAIGDDATDDEKKMKQLLTESLDSFLKMQLAYAKSAEMGGPSCFGEDIGAHMKLLNLGYRHVAEKTGIPHGRIRTLVECLDGPTPHETKVITDYLVPLIKKKEEEKNNPVTKTLSKFAESRMKLKAKKVARRHAKQN